MSDYTKRPWYTGDYKDGYLTIESDECDWERLAFVVVKPDDEIISEGIANARLIAAAPDLLAALKECITAVDVTMYGMAIHNARAAIAKATGDQP